MAQELAASQETGDAESPVERRTRAGRLTHLGFTAVRQISASVSTLLLLTLVGVVMYEICAREFTDAGAPPWTVEVSIYLFIALTFVASAMSIARDSQPRVRVLIERLPNALSSRIDVVTDALTLFLYGYIVWFGIKLAQFQWAQTGPASSISLGVAAIPIPVGAGLMALARLERMRLRSIVDVGIAAASIVAAWLVITQLGTPLQSSFYPLILVLLGVLFVSGMPIGETLLLSALVAYELTDPTASSVQYMQQLFSGLNTFTYVSVPLFLTTGAIIAGTAISARIVRFVREGLSWLPGSLGVVDVVASAVFADLSGSAVADTVAIGSVMLPEMERAGYPKPYAVALQATAGTQGILFPPSISALLFASAANVSVAYMFAATVLPGLIVTLSLMAYVMITAHRRKYGQSSPFRPRSFGRAFLSAVPSLGVIAIVLGGVFSGIFTSVEAGAVAATYSLVIGAPDLVRGGIRNASEIMANAAETVGRVCFVIAAALTFGWLIVANYGPQQIVSNLSGLVDHPILLLIVLMALVLVVHTMLDVSATIVVLVPILLPLLTQAKIDIVHFGVLLDINSTIGLILPPLGFCLYLVAGVSGLRIEKAARAVLPFVLILLADLALVLFIPSLTRAVPALLGVGS